jgi:hypothetical protein
MTEAEWLASEDPAPMLEWLRQTGKASNRRLRHFAVACCRRIEHVLDDPRCHDGLDAYDSYADGVCTRAALRTARRNVEAPYPFVVARLDLDAWVRRYLSEVGQFLNEYINKDWGKKQLTEKMLHIVGILEKYEGEERRSRRVRWLPWRRDS